jgi:hypothetical protein
MNIIINKEEHLRLIRHEVGSRILFGSRMYKTYNENSDYDYLCFYSTTLFEKYTLMDIYQPQHQFQYKQDNNDYIWTNINQFYSNLWKGDSIINADIMLFGTKLNNIDSTENEILTKLRTYKVIKAYLGFAKRDLKQHKEGLHKLKHAQRCLYIAECLINNIYPSLYEIQNQKIGDVQRLTVIEAELRFELNQMYDANLIPTYYVQTQSNDYNDIDIELYNKLITSLNTKQFKY